MASLLQVRDLNLEFSGAIPAMHEVNLRAAADVFRNAAHAYTRGLLNSVPTLRSSRSKPLQTIERVASTSAALLPRRLAEPRCPSGISACATELPPLVEVASCQLARCSVHASEAR